jgi:hypothetical protein
MSKGESRNGSLTLVGNVSMFDVKDEVSRLSAIYSQPPRPLIIGT